MSGCQWTNVYSNISDTVIATFSTCILGLEAKKNPTCQTGQSSPLYHSIWVVEVTCLTCELFFFFTCLYFSNTLYHKVSFNYLTLSLPWVTYSSLDMLIGIFNKQNLQNIISQSAVERFW